MADIDAPSSPDPSGDDDEDDQRGAVNSLRRLPDGALANL
jgi:hypothetical protein